MDYKVTLAACDPSATVALLGGDTFVKERAAAIASSLVSPEARQLWSRARNAGVRSAVTQVQLTTPGTVVSTTLAAALE
jgi:hypothetical protein